MSQESVITCVGEVLWDALPSGLFLGGAPLNVCLHLNQLGEKAEIVSRVGEDRLGKEAMARIQRAGLRTDFIQMDHDYQTGFVKVEVDEQGDPHYDIIKHVAWDYIDILSPNTWQLLQQSWAVVYGTLAHRINDSLIGLTECNGLKVLDMNLRAPHFEKSQVLNLMQHTDLIKMNYDEFCLLQNWCGFSEQTNKAFMEISETFECSTICMTRGGKGSALFHDNHYFEHPGYPSKVVDTVGAGDAFLASLLHGLKTGRNEEQLLAYANAAGTYVASCPGANPDYRIKELELLMQS